MVSKTDKEVDKRWHHCDVGRPNQGLHLCTAASVAAVLTVTMIMSGETLYACMTIIFTMDIMYKVEW